MFAPDQWTPVRRFGQFIGPPFTDRETAKGTRAAASHLEKFDTLAALATRLASNLALDNSQLGQEGYTPAIHGREFAALMEVLVCELYSALDGVRRALYGAYRDVAGVQNTSTLKLFKRAQDNAYDSAFPEEIRVALASASQTWFPTLRGFRTEVTHGHTGSCYLDATSGNISYIHDGLGTPTHAKVVPDIVGHINATAKEVRGLVDTVFTHLYSRLEQSDKRIMCGIYKGRMYERLVNPELGLTFDAGQCLSRSWFEQEPGLECPLRTRCRAYLGTATASPPVL